MIERMYFPINEDLAYYARQQWSFTDYVKGTTTADYKHNVDAAYSVVDKIEIEKPECIQEAAKIAERYSRMLAEWWNTKHSIDMMCPSVMICGPANFPTRKKERQISREKAHNEKYTYIQGLPKKIEKILKGDVAIKSNDQNAIVLLENKIEQLEAEHAQKLYWNGYYKKHKTLKGCDGLTDLQIASIEDFVTRNPFFTPFIVCNDTANIRRYKQRLEELKKAKSTPTMEAEINQSGVCKVVENTEIMRMQLIFDGKPSEQIRKILKSNGFVWAPSNSAWQRQLTENGRYATKRVLEELNKIA